MQVEAWKKGRPGVVLVMPVPLELVVILWEGVEKEV